MEYIITSVIINSLASQCSLHDVQKQNMQRCTCVSTKGYTGCSRKIFLRATFVRQQQVRTVSELTSETIDGHVLCKVISFNSLDQTLQHLAHKHYVTIYSLDQTI